MTMTITTVLSENLDFVRITNATSYKPFSVKNHHYFLIDQHLRTTTYWVPEKKVVGGDSDIDNLVYA